MLGPASLGNACKKKTRTLMNSFNEFVFVPLGGDCVALTREFCSLFSPHKRLTNVHTFQGDFLFVVVRLHFLSFDMLADVAVVFELEPTNYGRLQYHLGPVS